MKPRVVVRQVAAMAAKAYLMTFGSLVFWTLLPLALGWTPTVVMSGSMQPNIMVGDVIIAQPLTQQQVLELKPGFVLYAIDPVHADKKITHRVVNVLNGSGFVTKGDANAAADTTPMPVANVLGMERLRIPYIGIPLQAIRSGNYIPALVFAFSIMFAQIIIMINRSRTKSEDKEREREENEDESNDNDGPVAPTRNLRRREGALARSRRNRVLATNAVASGATVASAVMITISTAAFSSVVAPTQSTFAASSIFGSSATSSNYRAAVMDGYPFSYYRLNEASGTAAVDSSTSANAHPAAYSSTGIGYGAVGAMPRETNRGITLTGVVGDAITVPGKIPGPTNFTVETWFKTGTTTGGELLGFTDLPGNAATKNDRGLYMDWTGRLNVGIGTTFFSAPAAYNNNMWHHAAVTLSSTLGAFLYVDGAQVASSSIKAGTAISGNWNIGGANTTMWSGATSSYFPGSLDEVSFYNTAALTAAQIKADYTAGTTPTGNYRKSVLDDNPSYYYAFEETSGPTAQDLSPNANNAPYGASGTTYAAVGPLTQYDNRGATFNGSTGTINTTNASPGPQSFTLEVWFKTTAAKGGKLISFGNQQNTLSTLTNRMLYIADNGQVLFGTTSSATDTLATPAGSAYDDGAWHLATATLASSGAAFLYIDGQQKATKTVSAPSTDNGYWHIGGDAFGGGAWTNQPTSNFFNGTLDDVAIFPTALTPAQVLSDYRAI